MAAARIPGAPFKAAKPLMYLDGEFLIPEQSGTLASLRGVGAASALPGWHNMRTFIHPGSAVSVPPHGYDRVGMVEVQGRSSDEARARLARIRTKVRMDIR